MECSVVSAVQCRYLELGHHEVAGDGADVADMCGRDAQNVLHKGLEGAHLVDTLTGRNMSKSQPK